MKFEYIKSEFEVLKTLLLSEEMFSGKSLELLLDERDSEDFDRHWMRVYDEIQTLENENPISRDWQNLIDLITENSYRKIYSLTANADVSACVSDDMELIAKGLILDYQDKWLETLFNLYQQNIFPHGDILQT